MQEKARLEQERRKSRKVYKSGGMPKDEIWIDLIKIEEFSYKGIIPVNYIITTANF